MAQILAVVLAFLAIISLIRSPLLYLGDPSPSTLGRYWGNRFWLLAHMVGGMAAMLIGPFQFSAHIRRRFPRIHRWSGRSYLVGIFVAGIGAFYLAFFAEPASFGVAMFAPAAGWWITTGQAFLAVRQGRVSDHRRWMTRSYILTFAFVTFRWLIILPIWEPFGAHREAVATWAAWILPLVGAEIVFRHARRSALEAVA